MSRVLGIDYGERRIGLALSDPLGIIAKPLKVIDRKTTPDYKSAIVEIIDEKKVVEIIVGLPITMKNLAGSLSELMIRSTGIQNLIKRHQKFYSWGN